MVAIVAAALLLTAVLTRRLAGLKLRGKSVDRRLMNPGKGH
jgi:hypothetical protein